MKNILFFLPLVFLLMGGSAYLHTPNSESMTAHAIEQAAPTSVVFDPWLNGFKYRKQVDFSSGISLTTFQINFVFDTASLISAGKMRSDCNDIRVTTADGYSQVNYWVENCNSAYTRVWLKQSIGAGTTTYYVYYGNSGASNNGNGNNIFELFDDFSGGSLDTGKWTSWGTLRFSGTRLGIDQGSGIKSVATFQGDYIGEFKMTTHSNSLRRGTEFTTPGTTSFHFTDGGNPAGSTHSICCWSEIGMGSFTANVDRIWQQIDNSGTMIAYIGDPDSYSILNSPGQWRSLGNYAFGWQINVYGGGGGIDYYSVDYGRIRKYTSSEPTASVGSEVAIFTPTGSATSWSWSSPSVGNSIRSGSATSWIWRAFQDDGVGITIPNGGATSWIWYP